MSRSKLAAKAPVEVSPGHSKIMLFGRAGCGKTWLSLAFPAPYFVDSEGGARLQQYTARLAASGGSYLGPDDGATEFDVVLEQIKALCTERHQYKTLIIDSITKIYQSAISSEAERLGSKDAFGASKKPAIAAMRRLVNWAHRLDMNVVFCAHEATEWGATDGARAEIGKIPDAWEKLAYELDLVLRIEKHGKSYRTATVYKSRIEGFPDGDRFDLQNKDGDVGYKSFAERYGVSYIDAASTPVELATDESIKTLLSLIEAVNMPAEKVEKIKEKAKIDSWDELSAESCAKLITWIRSQIPNIGA